MAQNSAIQPIPEATLLQAVEKLGDALQETLWAIDQIKDDLSELDCRYSEDRKHLDKAKKAMYESKEFITRVKTLMKRKEGTFIGYQGYRTKAVGEDEGPCQ